METVKLSKLEIENQYPRCGSLAEVITRVEAKLWDDLKVIYQIKLNDVWLTAIDEEKIAVTNLNEVSDLTIRAKPLNALVSENLTAVITWISNARIALDKSVEHIDQKDYKSFSTVLVPVFDGCKWFSESLLLLQEPIKKISCEVADPPQWAVLQIELTKIIQKMVPGYQDKNYQLLSDLISFELMVIFEKWLELLTQQDKLIKKVYS